MPLARPPLLAWRRAYFFNKGLANGLVMVHPLLVALAYYSVVQAYSRVLGLGPGRPRPGACLESAARGARSAGLALALGAWWAQQELNWGGWWA